MTISLTILQTISGVPITDSVGTPVAPVLTPVVGKNQLRVQWSKESGLPGKWEALYKIIATDNNDVGIREVSVDWGDSTSQDFISGFGTTPVSDEISHTFSMSPSVIRIEFDNVQGGTEGANFAHAESLDTLWVVSQFQIERYRLSENASLYRKRFASDWRDIDASKSQDDFVDHRVDSAITWGYRIRFRQMNSEGLILGTTDWSSWSVQTPWA